jgi:hypothetical protein
MNKGQKKGWEWQFKSLEHADGGGQSRGVLQVSIIADREMSFIAEVRELVLAIEQYPPSRKGRRSHVCMRFLSLSFDREPL